jgi:hypothetical protein
MRAASSLKTDPADVALVIDDGMLAGVTGEARPFVARRVLPWPSQ